MAEKEYIERGAAYPLAKKICDAIDSDEFQRLNFGMRILDWIDDIPAADVRPVVRGKWTCHRTLEHDGDWWCTACGNELTIYMGNRPDRYKFCPNCGADMREGE